jgi:hypothetical protein
MPTKRVIIIVGTMLAACGGGHVKRGGTRAKVGRRTLKENGMVNKPAPRVF